MSLAGILTDPLIEILRGTAKGHEVWLVGGAIRDHLLGRTHFELDFAVDKNARDLARRFANACGGLYYELDAERDTGRVILQRDDGQRRTIDFARVRGEDITADLLARDFSINALAIPIDDPSELIDPSGGLQDLKDKILRACSADSMKADPVRTLRAIRLSVDFGLQIYPETSQLIRSAGPELGQVASERIRDELIRILDLNHPAKALRVLDHLGILTIWLPELEALRDLEQPQPHAFDGLGHSLAVCERLSDLLGVLAEQLDPDASGDLVLAQASFQLGRYRDQIRAHLNSEISVGRSRRHLLLFAALYHDVGKPEVLEISDAARPTFFGHEQRSADKVAQRARLLRLSGVEVSYLETVVRNHMRIEWLGREPAITDRAVYRFFRDSGDAGVDAVLISLADCLGKYAGTPPEDVWSLRVETAKRLLKPYFEEREMRIDPKAFLSGSDLMVELDLGPGPEIGQLLELIREAQAAGEVNSRDEGLALARAAMKDFQS
jgi:tRNA nucleotidyltransferase/poly(A) polymerase